MSWVLLAFPVLCVMGFLATRRRIHITQIVRILPIEGFPGEGGDAARVRFYKTEPLIIRNTRQVKNTVRWIGAGILGEILLFIGQAVHIRF